mmetsp:Transcript_71844/g.169121  ORF Transcript_71844/g.169121 Transcript_71844/m.169121 type:complete len:293 (-) Transcript_71844:63-941(-)
MQRRASAWRVPTSPWERSSRAAAPSATSSTATRDYGTPTTPLASRCWQLETTEAHRKCTPPSLKTNHTTPRRLWTLLWLGPCWTISTRQRRPYNTPSPSTRKAVRRTGRWGRCSGERGTSTPQRRTSRRFSTSSRTTPQHGTWRTTPAHSPGGRKATPTSGCIGTSTCWRRATRSVWTSTTSSRTRRNRRRRRRGGTTTSTTTRASTVMRTTTKTSHRDNQRGRHHRQRGECDSRPRGRLTTTRRLMRVDWTSTWRIQATTRSLGGILMSTIEATVECKMTIGIRVTTGWTE